ncbi:hypothetical protein ACIQUQ_12530 [Streptomyces sp. NPDC101118]|uniref:hypothetical protein n=1 Tax=Streptomyces sp. NPDC101118 TaxID=3366109 RepID=UPI0037FCA5CB
MRTVIRRTAVAVTAASLALLVTACGSDKPDAKKEAPAGDKGAQSSAPAAKALSTAELEKLLVEQADVPDYTVKADAKAKPVAAAGSAKADKAACQPFADAIGGTIATPAGQAVRMAVLTPKDSGKKQSPEEKALAGLNALKSPATRVLLGSYEGDGASEALNTVKNSGAECMSGFTVTQDGETTKITAATPMTLAAGEEATSWSFTMDMGGGDEAKFNLGLMRQGNTLASFYTFSLGGSVEELPIKVIDAQEKKLA